MLASDFDFRMMAFSGAPTATGARGFALEMKASSSLRDELVVSKISNSQSITNCAEVCE